MKSKKITYWVATGLFLIAFFLGALMDLIRSPALLKGMHFLGYPNYFCLIIGTWKMLAVVALLVPGYATIKEWAYAGIIFLLTGAIISHLASGDNPAKIIGPLVFIGLVFVSRRLSPEVRR